MTPRIGFVLVTHTGSDQADRLVVRLNAMFNSPPIVWHHDFSRSDRDTRHLPENVGFVRPHQRTHWARFSVVEAATRALRQMYEGSQGPDWFVLLSGSDYPIKPAHVILRDLETGGYDAHISHEMLRAHHFERDWQRECYDRYCTIRLFRYPAVTRRLRLVKRDLRLRSLRLASPFLPFSPDFRAFAGSQWFAANRRAAEIIIGLDLTRFPLALHYRRVEFPEESYFQCVLANAPQLKLHNCDYRYVDWSANEAHPKTLTLDDLPALTASDCHFARKFDAGVDARVLDEIDATLVARSSSVLTNRSASTHLT